MCFVFLALYLRMGGEAHKCLGSRWLVPTVQSVMGGGPCPSTTSCSWKDPWWLTRPSLGHKCDWVGYKTEEQSWVPGSDILDLALIMDLPWLSILLMELPARPGLSVIGSHPWRGRFCQVPTELLTMLCSSLWQSPLIPRTSSPKF